MKSLKLLVVSVAFAAAAALPAQAEVSIERGQYLVDGIATCGNCHTPRLPDGSFDMAKYLAGGFEFDEPVFHVFSRNITPDNETGIGLWTLEEIVTALRGGHTPEGEVLGPPMPIAFYRNISDDDAMSIAMYLKSIPAVRNELPDNIYNIPKPDFGPPPGGPTPPTTDPLVYGTYLAQSMGHCLDCHTPPNPDGSPNLALLGAGGFPILELAPGVIIYSANITSDPTTGIGNWTDAEVRTALTTGMNAEGHLLFPIMPYDFFKTMTDDDITAVITWLRTLDPIVHEVEHTDWMTALGIPMPPMEAPPPAMEMSPMGGM